MSDAPNPDRVFSSACPVCTSRMELLSRRPGFVSVGCARCHVQLTVPETMWATAMEERRSGFRPPDSIS